MMTRSLSLAVLLSAMAVAGPALAQEDTATENTATEDATASDATGIEMGTPVDPESGRQSGEVYVRAEEGDWIIRCATLVGETDPCVMYQLLADETGNPVAEIGLRPLPPGSPAAAAGNIVAPLETFLPAQLIVSVDGQDAVRYPYTFCTERPFSPFMSTGCVSQVGMSDALVGSFKRGSQAVITVRAAADREADVRLIMSLTGFTAAFDLLAADVQ